MKVLKSSNYDNKEIINHIKTSFSVLESSKSTFHTSEFLEVEMVSVSLRDGIYKVRLDGIHHKTYISELKTNKFEYFDNRVNAIKYILFYIGIISKEELNK
tara:strand:+ start:252 stop:554 length:303 start_codon:yes stop_codon:yes gene_type:complete